LHQFRSGTGGHVVALDANVETARPVRRPGDGLRAETRTLDQIETRVRRDLEYLRKWPIELDLVILAKTVLCVLNGSKAF
jgi:hypothetical protein